MASKYLRYNVAYEGGSKFVVATSDEEALRIFREEWSEYGDEPPACWIEQRWTMR